MTSSGRGLSFGVKKVSCPSSVSLLSESDVSDSISSLNMNWRQLDWLPLSLSLELSLDLLYFGVSGLVLLLDLEFDLDADRLDLGDFGDLGGLSSFVLLFLFLLSDLSAASFLQTFLRWPERPQ